MIENKHSLSVVEVSTNSSCYQSPPHVDHADKSENDTHVTYTCHQGYHFVDKNLTKTYDCSCASMADLLPCVGKKSWNFFFKQLFNTGWVVEREL